MKNQKSAYRIQLENEAKQLMGSANAKLLNLEKLATKEGYEDIEQFAYRLAQKQIKNIRGEGYKRFNIPANTHQLEKTVREMKKFLDMPTSSKAGIDTLYEDNAKFLNEKFGTNYSWQEMAKFLQNVKWDEAKKTFDSETAILMIQGLLEHKTLNPEEIDELLNEHKVDFHTDEVDNDTLNNFVRQNIDWNELF